MAQQTRLARFAEFVALAERLGAIVRTIGCGRGVEAEVTMARADATPTVVSVWCRRTKDAAHRLAELKESISRYRDRGYIVFSLDPHTPAPIRRDWLTERNESAG